MIDPLKVTNSQDIKGLVSEAGNTSAGQIRDKYMSAAEGAKGLLRPDEQIEKRIGMSQNPMSEAIKRKVNMGFQNSQSRLRQKTGLDARVDHLKKLEVASNLASEEHELNMEKVRIKREMARAKKAARGQVLGSVLGTVAGVAATVYTGGNVAAGAAAYQAGQGLGQSMGSR